METRTFYGGPSRQTHIPVIPIDPTVSDDEDIDDDDVDLNDLDFVPDLPDMDLHSPSRESLMPSKQRLVAPIMEDVMEEE